MGGRWAGLFSGLIFLTFREPVLEHGILSNNMESALILQYTGSIYHFQAWIGQAHGGARRATHVLAMALLFVLGFMTKFVAALFLPLIVLIVLLAYPRLLKRALSEWSVWLMAAGLALVLIAPWFIYQSADGRAGILGRYLRPTRHEALCRGTSSRSPETLALLPGRNAAHLGCQRCPNRNSVWLSGSKAATRANGRRFCDGKLVCLVSSAGCGHVRHDVEGRPLPVSFPASLAIIGGIGTARLLTLGPAKSKITTLGVGSGPSMPP